MKPKSSCPDKIFFRVPKVFDHLLMDLSDVEQVLDDVHTYADLALARALIFFHRREGLGR